MKGREAEHDSRQGDESKRGVLDPLRVEVGAVILEPIFYRLINLFWTVIWDPSCKGKVSPSVEKSEKQAKDERLEEFLGIPIPSQVLELVPQRSHLCVCERRAHN